MPLFTVHLPNRKPIPLDAPKGECLIGRAPELGIVIEDAAISRQHARLFWTGDDVFLEDLGSRHGCYVNGERVQGVVGIGDQDEVRLGHIPMRLETTQGHSLNAEVTVSLALPMESLRGWKGAVGILHTISLMLVKELPAEELFRELLDRLYEYLGAAKGAVLLREDGELRTVATQGGGGGITLSSRTLQAVLDRREAQVLRDPTTGNGLTLSVMTVPLEYEGEVLGLLYFDGPVGGRGFAEDELRFVAALCNLAAAKLVHQRTALELQRRREQERELELASASAMARSAFLAQVSHEIRTPMNAILGFTQLASQQSLPSPVANYLRKIESSGRLLMGLLNDLLDLSKLEANGLKLEAIPFDLAGVLATVDDLFRSQAGGKGLHFEIRSRGELPPGLVGDPLRLTQVLVNLIGNAVKFTEQGFVRLELVAEAPADGRCGLRFSVSDSGVGMAQAFLQRLFEPFAQEEASTSRRYGGTGLGLSICKRLVDMMGGSIQAESHPGEGSRFTFTLALQICNPPQAPPEAHPTHHSALEGIRILVVEDYVINYELLIESLQRMGARVDLATGGLEALGMVLPGRFDALLMDVEMPGMDGIETTGRIRMDPALAELPIIAMTAQADEECRLRCLAAGMNDFLTKPFDVETLRRTLGYWVARSPRRIIQAPRPYHEVFRCLAPVMDTSGALDRVQGNAGLLLRMLRGFLTETMDLEAIPRAMAAGDQAEAMRQAHNMKGAARMLSLGAVADAAQSMEARLRSAEVEGWEGLYAQLSGAVQAFRSLALQLPKALPESD